MTKSKILSVILAGAMVASMSAVAVISVSAYDTYSIIGSVNGSWDTDTYLTDDDGDGIYEVTIEGVEAGSYEYKVRADGSWDVSWGAADDDGVTNVYASNLTVELEETSDVTFYFDTTGDESTWTCTYEAVASSDDTTDDTDSTSAYETFSIIGDVNGSWDTDTYLTDDDGDGIYEATIEDVAAGSYEYKVRADSSWTVSWGAADDDGITNASGGSNLTIELEETDDITSYDVTFYFDTTSDDESTWLCTYEAVASADDDTDDTDADDTDTDDTDTDDTDTDDTDTDDADTDDTDTDDTTDTTGTETGDTTPIALALTALGASAAALVLLKKKA